MEPSATISDIEDLHPPEAAPQPKPSSNSSKGAFNWAQQWHPLVPEWYLDRRRPRGLTLLGHRLVVWWDARAAAWRSFEDKCPHRMAPLSEGRIEPATGHLQCSYHGWTFNGTGRCAGVPQADSERQLEVVCSARRSCVAAYPVCQAQGLLWVWMDSGPAATAESASRAPALPTELQDGSGTLLGEWYTRDLPISYEFLLENLMDPSHIHWAHHGIIGRREQAAPIKIELEGPVSAQGGFTLLFRQRLDSAAAFLPPSLAWLSFRPGGGRRFSLVFYAVPVAPHSRIVAGYSTNALPGWLSRALRKGPVASLVRSLQWVSCLGSHEVLDGDTLFIRDQEQNALADGRGWKSTYFMPAGSDRGVVQLRRWLEREGGGGPVYGPHAAPLQALPAMTREQVLDRYSQHTRDCPSCRRALHGVRGLRSVLSAAATSGLAAGAALAAVGWTALPPHALAAPSSGSLATARGAGSAPVAGILAAAALCGLLSRALGRLERRFVFTDYVHAHK